MHALEAELGNLSAKGVRSDGLYAGHSMGEYTALVAAGSISYTPMGCARCPNVELDEELAGRQAPGDGTILGLEEAQVAENLRSGVWQRAPSHRWRTIIVPDESSSLATVAAWRRHGVDSRRRTQVVPLAVSIAAHGR